MNKYVRNFFRIMFPDQQMQHDIYIQQQPSPISPEEWHQYWQEKGIPWRTEAEIDIKRQEELSNHLAIVPDFEQGIYPFKEMKLTRADVEWLLATHDNGQGPVNWSDESQRKREGIDVRGADLRGIDLSGLPLACMIGGLNMIPDLAINSDHRKKAAVILDGANLRQAHLEGAILYNASIKDAALQNAFLQDAKARWVRMEGSRMRGSHLEGADLQSAHLEGNILSTACLDETNLRAAFFDSASWLTTLGSKDATALVSRVRWGGVDLTRIDWSQVIVLGDERIAKKPASRDLQLTRLHEAVRAYRKLTIELQGQGLDEVATRFAYRAQMLQRKTRWIQGELGPWFFSLFLALLAGYGYRMWRIIVAYLLVVSICAIAYFVIGLYHPPHLNLLQASLESITAFHGRVFYELFIPDTPQIWVTAFEAIAGLIIESVFIAMLTQRFFRK